MKFKVIPISYNDTKSWLLYVHYAKRMPSITYAFGIYDDGVCKGVVTFGSPPSMALCKGVCGEENASKVLELNRLVISEDMPRNTASYFVSRAIKQLPRERILVSYADTSQNHVGYVYQATNWIYTGLSAKRSEWRVKGLEHLHSRTLSRDMTLEEMRQKYGSKLYFADRPQKHRYVYFNKCKKETVDSLRYEILPYPKGKSKRYETSDKKAMQNQQTRLFI